MFTDLSFLLFCFVLFCFVFFLGGGGVGNPYSLAVRTPADSRFSQRRPGFDSRYGNTLFECTNFGVQCSSSTEPS